MDSKARTLITQLHRMLGELEEPLITLQEVWDRYWAAEGRATRSGRVMRHWMAPILAFRPRGESSLTWAELPAADITKPQAREYERWRQQQPGRRKGTLIAPSTTTCELSMLMRVLSWAADERLIGESPLRGLTLQPVRQRRGSVRGAAFVAIFDELSDWMQILMLLCLRTGMRIDLARRLRWDEIDLDSGRIRPTEPDSVSKKRGEPRAFGDVLEALRQMPRVEGSPWVFTSHAKGRWGKHRRGHVPYSYSYINKLFHSAVEAAGVTTADGETSIHHLRHGFALDGLEVYGWSIKVLMARGGWTTINSVARYGALDRVADDEAQERAERALAIQRELLLNARRGPHAAATTPSAPSEKERRQKID